MDPISKKHRTKIESVAYQIKKGEVTLEDAMISLRSVYLTHECTLKTIGVTDDILLAVRERISNHISIIFAENNINYSSDNIRKILECHHQNVDNYTD